jgi:predicted RNase H-like HicB family nuclease
MFDYPVVLSAQAEGGFVATFPDVPEAITQGEDRDEVLLYAVDALKVALSFYIAARCGLRVWASAHTSNRHPGARRDPLGERSGRAPNARRSNEWIPAFAGT